MGRNQYGYINPTCSGGHSGEKSIWLHNPYLPTGGRSREKSICRHNSCLLRPHGWEKSIQLHNPRPRGLHTGQGVSILGRNEICEHRLLAPKLAVPCCHQFVWVRGVRGAPGGWSLAKHETPRPPWSAFKLSLQPPGKLRPFLTRGIVHPSQVVMTVHPYSLWLHSVAHAWLQKQHTFMHGCRGVVQHMQRVGLGPCKGLERLFQKKLVWCCANKNHHQTQPATQGPSGHPSHPSPYVTAIYRAPNPFALLRHKPYMGLGVHFGSAYIRPAESAGRMYSLLHRAALRCQLTANLGGPWWRAPLAPGWPQYGKGLP